MTGTDAPDMKAAALELHDAGWWPIPNHWITSNGKCSCLTFESQKRKECASPGKHPLIRWEEAQKRQLTRDEIEIYWDTWPLANIGVITGPESGIVCLDVDVKDGVDGNQTIKDHADAGRILPETFTDARGDGKHPFFWYPKNAPAELRNIQDGKLGPGLDLRAAGGQVIIAPSMHFSGERRRIVDPRPPVDLPQWVIDLALSTQKPEKTHGNAPVPLKQVNEKGSGLPLDDRKRLISAYVKKHFSDKVVAGNRHHTLMQIGGLMRSAGSNAEEIFDYLTEFNLTRCDPQKPDAESEIREIAGYMVGKPVTMSPPDEIVLTHRQLPELSEAALYALRRKNDPPRLFTRTGSMVFVDRDEKGVPYIRVLGDHGLRGELARACEWKRATKKDEIVDASPPLDISRDILSRPVSEWNLPPLEAVVQTPIIHPDGTILPPGYDPETLTYYLPEPGFVLSPVPETPTEEDITAAITVIQEPFKDFPFVDSTAKANAIAALFTAVLRPIIDGPVPCFICDKPQAASGASLLQKMIYSVATGLEPEEKGAPKKEEEWEKRLLAILRSGRPVCIFDNVEGVFKSENLARVLTSRICAGRILGETEEVQFPNRCTWMANGNNIQIGGDLARRVYVSRIDPKVPIPWEREGFVHPDLLRWCREHRGEIVGAVLTLTRAWLAVKAPRPSKVPLFGGYDSWRDTIGGILEYIGIDDFLKNAREVYLTGDADLQEDELFISALLEQFKTAPWSVRDLVDVLGNRCVVPGKLDLTDCLPERLSNAWKRQNKDFSKVAGKALASYNGKRYPSGYMIIKDTQDTTTKAWLWCVKQWKEDNPPSQPPLSNPANPAETDDKPRGIGVSGVFCEPTHKKKIRENVLDHALKETADQTRKPRYPGNASTQIIRFIPVRILHDLEPFQGIDGRVYDCHRGDLITLPEPHARVLVDQRYAVLVAPGEETQEGRTTPPVLSPVKPFRWQEEIG